MKKLAVMIVALTLIFGVGATTAFGDEVHSAAEVMKLLAERLKVEPHLEAFGSDSPEEQQMLSRALGITEWMDEQYRGASPGDILTEYKLTGLNTVEDEAVRHTATVLADGEGGVGVATEADVASGALETAAETLGTESLATVASAAILPALAVAGAATVGWLIGEQLVETFPFLKIEESAPVVPGETFDESPPVEKFGWERLELCGGYTETAGKTTVDPALVVNAGAGYSECHGDHGPGPLGSEATIRLAQGHEGDGLYEIPVPNKPYWILIEEIEKTWYADDRGYKLRKYEHSPWPFGDPHLEGEGEGAGCAGVGTLIWAESEGLQFEGYAAGTPPHFKKLRATIREFGEQHRLCTPYLEVEVEEPPESKHFVTERVPLLSSLRGVNPVQVVQTRSASQQAVHFPKHGVACKAEIGCEHLSVPELPSEKAMAEGLEKAAQDPEHQNFEKWVDHETGSLSDKEAPLPGVVKVPNCTSLTVSECEIAIEEVGLVPELDPLTWEHAHLDKPAGAFVETTPNEGTEDEEGNKVGIIYNPLVMPKVIPRPKTGETGEQYKERLESEGFTNVESLTRTEVDPRVGPGEVSYVNPAPGTDVNPDGGEKVEVESNPKTAPPAETPSGIGPPTEPGIHFPKLGVLCKSFPFGVPCWLIEEITAWSATAKAPVWGIGSMKIMGHTIPGASFDLAKLEPIMELVRPAMMVFATIGLVLLFYKFATGGSPDSGSQSDSSSVDIPSPDSDIYL